ncbi:MAG: hydroxyethylthiazole kinase, partial [Clostridiaceae bacterium]|nr:hydroxyethylthiazole kinase [Clostridiaceae bacterium]
MEVIREAAELLTKIKEYRPLIHHITNYVTMNDCANAVLAIGGS